MLAGLSLGTDVRRYFRGTLPRIALITVIVLPLLYGAMYLWAFWNPFAEVDRVPVALVNLDRGAIVDGRDLRAGDQVADALLTSGELDLTPMSADQAADSVAHGRQYFSITLPEDFSAAIASPSGAQPRQARIRFTFNDANNYLASIIGQNTAREVLNQVGARIGQKVVGQVLIGVSEAGDGLRKAAAGAGQLAAGSDAANAGAHELVGGSRTLADNMIAAREGATALAAGSSRLSSAITTATDPVITVLDRIAMLRLDPDQVGETATRLSQVVETAADRVAALNIDHAQAAAIVDQVVDGLGASADPTARNLGDVLAGARRILQSEGADLTTDEGLDRLRDRAHQFAAELGDPDSQLRVFLTRLLDGALKSDIVTLRNGAAELTVGARKLSTGLTQLTDGSVRLADGAAALSAGTAKLHDGARELAAKLDEGAKQAPSWTGRQRDEEATVLASPVRLDMRFMNQAATFGTGFAPFFLPLALFIGALIIWMLLTPLQARPITNGLGALRVVVASYWPGLLVAACQVLVMYAVVHVGVGLHPRHAAATVAFLLLIVAVFLALIQAFNAVFGVAVGRVITLAFLMFQLVSAGGIYPVETTAKPFQILHPLDPMTYAVNGLREVIVGGVDARLGIAVTVLGGVLAASLAASAWAARRNRQYTMDRLYPPIEV
ncbi:YhgE/Pip domain-containing protein [Mycobacterium sp.]|uniref:YhgE/Pip domain-containing protein n=1 Tax=Mycobacterium sp. TaxID=1785 RepID=UPI0031D21BAD